MIGTRGITVGLHQNVTMFQYVKLNGNQQNTSVTNLFEFKGAVFELARQWRKYFNEGAD